MNCRNCQYPLWTIKPRACPECGQPFNPAEYDFVPYAVRFNCPHCGQVYYGDGERGRLVPSEFDCIGCGRHVTMAEMVVEPAAGVEEQQTQNRKAAWLERKSIGLPRAWVRTVGMAMVAPGELMTRVSREAEGTGKRPMLGPALLFMLLSQTLIWIVAAVPLWAIMGFRVVGRATGRSGGPLGPDIWFLLVLFAIGLAGTIGVGMVFAMIAHLLLVLTGPRAGGPRRTMTAMAYSSGANVLSAIPCIGAYIGWVWWVGSGTAMLATVQRVRPWRAVVAVIGPVVVAVVLVIGGYAWFMYWAMSQAAAGAAATSAPTAAAGAAANTMPGPSGASSTVAAVLLSCVHRTGGWPGHVAQLLADGTLTADQLIVPPSAWSQTSPADVRIGGLTLAEFESATPEQRTQAVKAATSAVPASDAAYRVGDLVVCVRAGQPMDLGPDLWLLIAWPDPDIHGNNPPPFCLVTTTDGVPTPILASQFDARLQAQNALRAKAGLPPLPHPRDVHQTGSPPVEDDPSGG